MKKRLILLIVLALLLVGCGAAQELVAPLDLQKEIFLAQDANARKVLSVYDAKLRQIVLGVAKTSLQEELAKVTDAEGRAKVTDLLMALNKVNEDRDADLGALDKKKAEHTAALNVNKASFMAMDMKMKEFIAKEKLSAADINLLLTELAAIYAQFKEGTTNATTNR